MSANDYPSPPSTQTTNGELPQSSAESPILDLLTQPIHEISDEQVLRERVQALRLHRKVAATLNSSLRKESDSLAKTKPSRPPKKVRAATAKTKVDISSLID